MSTKAGRFRQRDLTRALKAIADAGLVAGRVEIDPSGKLIIEFTNSAGTSTVKANELDVWLASHARAP
jgi:hypothetical protein